MPIVEVKEVINRDIARVWERICDVDSYGDFMQPVRSVRTISTDGDHSVVEWEVILKGSLMNWTESETRFPDRYRVEFEQIDGDLERFVGFWQLTALADTVTEAVLTIDFEIGIPMLRDMLDPVAERALRENSRQMLVSLNEESVA